MNLEQVGGVSIQGVAGKAIPAKLVKVDVRIWETPSDTDEENRTNQVKFTITPYVSLVCACVEGMESKETFLLHPEIIAELKAIPQLIIKREEAVQANVITRAQRLLKEREEAKANDEEEREDEGKNKNESEGDEQSDDKSRLDDLKLINIFLDITITYGEFLSTISLIIFLLLYIFPRINLS